MSARSEPNEPHSPANRIAVIGEAVADAIIDPVSPPGELRLRVKPGGSPANTAVALSRLGTPTQFLGRLASGALGDLLRHHLAGSHVDITACVAAGQMPTLAIATIDGDGHAGYRFYVEGTADWHWTDRELSGWDPQGTVAIHTGSLALTQPPGNAAIEALLARVRRQMTVCIDPNVRASIVAPGVYREAVARWARLADMVRLSVEDLQVMLPGVSVQECYAQLHEAGVPVVVVTRGSHGACASVRGEAVTVTAHPARVVDTVGAGDSFSAGLLHRLRALGALGGRLESLTAAKLTDAMEFATLVAARTCQREGADPPWWHELPVLS